MKKTFVVGFIGLFLVGGFLSGLYLINRPTNPPTSASEIVNPVRPPNQEDSIGAIPSISTTSATLLECQKVYGKQSTDSGFNENCDLDKNGIINVLDLQKLR